MEEEYHYLTAPNCYLFLNKEDGKNSASLDITIVDKIVSYAYPDYIGDTNYFKGSYYDSKFGWDAVWSQTVKFNKNHFELICMLEDVGDHMTPEIEKFFQTCISKLFEKRVQWNRK